MVVISLQALYDVLVFGIICIAGLVSYFKWKFTYWEKKHLPHLEGSFPFGTMENPFTRTKSLAFWLKDNYNQLKSNGHKHGGLYNFTMPMYLPVAPEYIKNVMQKDFQYFVDRGIYYNEKDDPLSAHLLAIGGQKWRNLRTKLTPTFTSGKMKMMFDILMQCSVPMERVMEQFTKNGQPIDIKEVAACFTTDIIGSCAFGLECNSFKAGDAEFRSQGKRILQRTKFDNVSTLIFNSMPELGRWLRIRMFSTETSNFFTRIVEDTVSYRETNNIVRKDMLQILIDIKNKGGEGVDNHDGTTLTIEEIAAQAFVFFVAGFETSSTTMSFCLFELASNKEIQQKVRNEINEVLTKHDGKITYESIMDMQYMTQVVEETLRKYPPAPHVYRKCVKDYNVPGTDVVIEKDTQVFIPILALHHDPEFYPKPEKFDPDRFAKEKKEQRHSFTYIPFGEGPRICIGMRFGMMQTKVGLAVLLKNYEFSVGSKTTVPLEIDPYKLILTTKDTIWLDAKKLD